MLKSSSCEKANAWGPQVLPKGVNFRLWAPQSSAVSLIIEGEEQVRPMRAGGRGVHELEVSTAGPGTRYRFELANGQVIPDPLSRFQPQDVHGPSEVIDPSSYSWRMADWRGRPWEEAVVYELHVGTFTPEGTFRSAVERLDALVNLGVTAIEVMPVADFPGRWNWGYDGTLLFAPESSYGRPDDLKALVDAAHERGLMVILDVVYNHFGPEGNYLPACGPIFTESHHTPWGAAVNFDADGSDAVRELIISNAVYWLDEFRFDGLRLDAVHTIKDDSTKHILEEIAERVRQSFEGREIHLILENDANEASLLARDPEGRPLHYTAQWNDDIHHLLHTATAQELQDFYADYSGDTGKLGRALAEGFAFQGEWTTHNPRSRGEPSAFLPPTAFLSFVQNHDQVGNRPFGERFTALAPREAARAAVATCLLSPQIPLLFMGEEWGAESPFLFFSEFSGDLADAVRNGRRESFARYPDFQAPDRRDLIPDPISERTFASSKLDWDEAERDDHREWLEFYRALLAVRRAEIVPRLKGIGGQSATYEVLGPQAVRVAWNMGDGSLLTVLANLKAEALSEPARPEGRLLWEEGSFDADRPGPWTVVFSIVDADARA